MTYAAHCNDFAAHGGDRARPHGSAVAGRKGLLRRILDAVFESHQRQTDREIARLLAQSGERFTDDVERRMMRHLTTSDWSVRG